MLLGLPTTWWHVLSLLLRLCHFITEIQESPVPFRDILLEQQVLEEVSSELQKTEGSCLKAWPWTFLYLVLSMPICICIRDRLEHSLSVQMHAHAVGWCTLPVAHTCVCPSLILLPDAWSTAHSSARASSQLEAFASLWERSGRLETPQLSFHHIIYPMWPHFLIIYVLSKEKTFFFLSLSERVLSIFSYMVTSTAWDLIGKLLWLVFHWPLRKPFHRELQQMLPVQIRSIQGIVLSLQSLSHIFLWEGLGEGHQFAASHYKTIWEVAITNIFSSLG